MSAHEYHPPGPPFARKAVAAAISQPAGFEPVRAVSRRDFIKAGGVFVVGVSLFGCTEGEQAAPPVVAEQAAPVAAAPWYTSSRTVAKWGRA